ncbi:hypothetical protein AMECASPLE_034515 [Ameca splendens]|uniref:Uncharacterized protein n=1 Tax=Ameca splendens TaxID=208324 RepID=A0ABV0Z547_9TELE
MVTSLQGGLKQSRGALAGGDACSCHLDNKKQMSQLGNTDRLSQAYSTWPSLLLGSGSCVIFIYSPVLDALTICPHLSSQSPLLVLSLSFFICLYLSINLCPGPIVSYVQAD